MDRDHEVMEGRPGDHRGVGRYLRSAVVSVVLLVVGAAAGMVWSERRASLEGGAKGPAAKRSAPSDGAASQGGSMPGMPAPTGPATKTDDPIEVSLTPEAIERAGIKIAEVKGEAAAPALTVPATVMSNAYRDTKVNALVGGIVSRVSVELGSPVERGQPLAVIFSSELAEAQMKYLSMRAMVQADRQKLQRTQKLVELGAASRQELEEITATYSARETEVAAAGQRLLLLGLSQDRVANLESASQAVSEVTVPAPATGIVITRAVNPGQVVSAGQDLFVVTDLSSVWVVGDLYEKDFSQVRVGSDATISLQSAPNTVLRARVAYIDPRVDAAARTAKVRVEVPNRNSELRLGMFVTVKFQTGTAQRMTLVPRNAVQSVGERTVVYVPVEGEEGKFAERPVKLGQPVGDFVQVLEGLKPGDKVVTDGSFSLRAEATRTRSGG